MALMDILTSPSLCRVVLPLNETVSKPIKALWQTPTSLQPTVKQVERKYFMPPTDTSTYICTCPLDSLVVATAYEQERQGPSPKIIDAKELDLLGRKFTPQGDLQLKISNHHALLRHYDFNFWTTMSKFKELLPSESRTEFVAVVEDRAITKASLQASLGAADAVAHAMGTVVVMRCSSWFQLSGLPYEVQMTVQDLPFEGCSLFSDQTDAHLHSLKDSRATLKSLGLHMPAPSSGHFKPQPQSCFHHSQQRQDFGRWGNRGIK